MVLFALLERRTRSSRIDRIRHFLKCCVLEECHPLEAESLSRMTAAGLRELVETIQEFLVFDFAAC